MTPSWRQRIIASDWLMRVWMVGLPILLCVVTIRFIGPIGWPADDLRLNALLALSVLLSLLLGWFVSVPTAWVLFGPILMEQGCKNGGPFKRGDRVLILAGRYRDRIAVVYGYWQNETVRVDLGDKAKNRYADIFADYQLLRVPAKGTNVAEQDLNEMSANN